MACTWYQTTMLDSEKGLMNMNLKLCGRMGIIMVALSYSKVPTVHGIYEKPGTL